VRYFSALESASEMNVRICAKDGCQERPLSGISITFEIDGSQKRYCSEYCAIEDMAFHSGAGKWIVRNVLERRAVAKKRPQRENVISIDRGRGFSAFASEQSTR
jgi:hypothetical protein